jgi:hypothetical protein
LLQSLDEKRSQLDVCNFLLRHGNLDVTGILAQSVPPGRRRQRRRAVTFDNFNFRIVHVLEYLPKITHVEPFAAARAFHKVIGFGLSDAVGIHARFCHLSFSGPAMRKTFQSSSYRSLKISHNIPPPNSQSQPPIEMMMARRRVIGRVSETDRRFDLALDALRLF